MEDSYKDVGLFYDAIVGDRSDTTKKVLQKIRQHAPKAKTILEVACGTGSFLHAASKRYTVSGLDLSETMLIQASEKCPAATLYQGDMRSFDVEQTYDVLVCLFDSINHLTTKKDWKNAFRSLRHHLKPGGLCIFDVNTPYKLSKVAKEPPLVHEFEGHTFILDVEKISANRFNWNARIFAPVTDDLFACVDQAIPEAAFSVTDIRELLKDYFVVKKIEDADRSARSQTSERLFFICTAK